jgi:hypothetical protein
MDTFAAGRDRVRCRHICALFSHLQLHRGCMLGPIRPRLPVLSRTMGASCVFRPLLRWQYHWRGTLHRCRIHRRTGSSLSSRARYCHRPCMSHAIPVLYPPAMGVPVRFDRCFRR